MDGGGKHQKYAVGFWPTFTAAEATLNGACDDAFGRRRDTTGFCAVTSRRELLTMKTTAISLAASLPGSNT